MTTVRQRKHQHVKNKSSASPHYGVVDGGKKLKDSSVSTLRPAGSDRSATLALTLTLVLNVLIGLTVLASGGGLFVFTRFWFTQPRMYVNATSGNSILTDRDRWRDGRPSLVFPSPFLRAAATRGRVPIGWNLAILCDDTWTDVVGAVAVSSLLHRLFRHQVTVAAGPAHRNYLEARVHSFVPVVRLPRSPSSGSKDSSSSSSSSNNNKNNNNDVDGNDDVSVCDLIERRLDAYWTATGGDDTDDDVGLRGPGTAAVFANAEPAVAMAALTVAEARGIPVFFWSHQPDGTLNTDRYSTPGPLHGLRRPQPGPKVPGDWTGDGSWFQLRDRGPFWNTVYNRRLDISTTLQCRSTVNHWLSNHNLTSKWFSFETRPPQIAVQFPTFATWPRRMVPWPRDWPRDVFVHTGPWLPPVVPKHVAADSRALQFMRNGSAPILVTASLGPQNNRTASSQFLCRVARAHRFRVLVSSLVADAHTVAETRVRAAADGSQPAAQCTENVFVFGTGTGGPLDPECTDQGQCLEYARELMFHGVEALMHHGDPVFAAAAVSAATAQITVPRLDRPLDRVWDRAVGTLDVGVSAGPADQLIANPRRLVWAVNQLVDPASGSRIKLALSNLAKNTTTSDPAGRSIGAQHAVERFASFMNGIMLKN